MRIPWSKPKIGEAEKEAVKNVVDSGWWTSGDELEDLEDMIEEYLGCGAAVVMNGTQALRAALIAHDIGEGDRVLVPTYTFAASVNAIISVGAEPVLVDCDLETYNISIDDVKRKIGEVDALMVVDVAGMPVDIDKMVSIANREDVTLIQDSAESLGAKYKGEVVGGQEHTQTFSLHMAKLATSVEGGIITGSSEIISRVRKIRNHGMEGKYHHTVYGENMRITDLQASIGRIQMKQIDDFLERRDELAGIYRSELAERVRFQKVPSYVTQHPYMIFQTRFENKETRDRVENALNEDSIDTRVCWKPVHLQPYFKERFGELKGLENSEELYDTTLSLPIGNAMTLDEAKEVSKVVNESL